MKAMRPFVLSVIMVMALASAASAAGPWSGETEMGGGQESSFFAQQYLFFDEPQNDWLELNVLARYFYVDQAINRGEIALGPTFKARGVIVKFHYGGTTDRQVMLATTVLTSFSGHSVVYIGDAKLATDGTANTFYEKMFVALTRDNVWQFRVDDLLIGESQGFLRIGGEYRYQLLGGICTSTWHRSATRLTMSAGRKAGCGSSIGDGKEDRRMTVNMIWVLWVGALTWVFGVVACRASATGSAATWFGALAVVCATLCFRFCAGREKRYGQGLVLFLMLNGLAAVAFFRLLPWEWFS